MAVTTNILAAIEYAASSHVTVELVAGRRSSRSLMINLITVLFKETVGHSLWANPQQQSLIYMYLNNQYTCITFRFSSFLCLSISLFFSFLPFLFHRSSSLLFPSLNAYARSWYMDFVTDTEVWQQFVSRTTEISSGHWFIEHLSIYTALYKTQRQNHQSAMHLCVRSSLRRTCSRCTCTGQGHWIGCWEA